MGYIENFLLIVMLSIVAFGFEIDDHTPDQIVSEGSIFTMSCHVRANLIENKDWKTCSWSRNSDGAECKYEYIQKFEGWIIEESCDTAIEDTQFFGSDPNNENKLCGIVVPSADSLDNGTWSCKIHPCKYSGCAAEKGSVKFDKADIHIMVRKFM